MQIYKKLKFSKFWNLGGGSADLQKYIFISISLGKKFGPLFPYKNFETDTQFTRVARKRSFKSDIIDLAPQNYGNILQIYHFHIVF